MEIGRNLLDALASTSKSSEVEVAAVRVRLVRLDQAEAAAEVLLPVAYTMPMLYQLL